MSADRAIDSEVARGSAGIPRRWIEPVTWAVAVLVLLAGGWRAVSRPDPYAPGSRLPTVEDRRDHRFRNLTYAQAQRLLVGLMHAADQAPNAHHRAVALARAAALQHERGYQEFADDAAREAVRIAGADPEVHRLLAEPLDLQALKEN